MTDNRSASGAGPILSLRDGEVWASWPDGRPSVPLGEQHAALAEMRRFMLQGEVAERLIRHAQAALPANGDEVADLRDRT